VKNKPLFFLGHLERREEPGAVSVWISGRELARELTAPAAMNQGERIFIRRESFRRLLWEKLEAWRWHRPDNALGRAFACYDFENALESSLDAMVEQELNAVLLHEQGEYQVGCEVGERWNQLLMDLGYTPAELMARAIRDHWADCLVTLPELIRQAGYWNRLSCRAGIIGQAWRMSYWFYMRCMAMQPPGRSRSWWKAVTCSSGVCAVCPI
jgi:hypothetical protein